MASRVSTFKIDKAFRQTAQFEEMQRVASAAFEPRLTGGFEKIINARQSSWSPLNTTYAEWKAKNGLDSRKWIRTGRTLKAMSQGRIEKEGTKRGMRFKFQRNGKATLTPRTFDKKKRGKKSGRTRKSTGRNVTGTKLQERILGRMQYDDGRKRPLFTWTEEELPDLLKAVSVEFLKSIGKAVKSDGKR